MNFNIICLSFENDSFSLPDHGILVQQNVGIHSAPAQVPLFRVLEEVVQRTASRSTNYTCSQLRKYRTA